MLLFVILSCSKVKTDGVVEPAHAALRQLKAIKEFVEITAVLTGSDSENSFASTLGQRAAGG
jgi:hypothetical protein